MHGSKGTPLCGGSNAVSFIACFVGSKIMTLWCLALSKIYQTALELQFHDYQSSYVIKSVFRHHLKSVIQGDHFLSLSMDNFFFIDFLSYVNPVLLILEKWGKLRLINNFNYKFFNCLKIKITF